jgi:hypothetical protein
MRGRALLIFGGLLLNYWVALLNFEILLLNLPSFTVEFWDSAVELRDSAVELLGSAVEFCTFTIKYQTGTVELFPCPYCCTFQTLFNFALSKNYKIQMIGKNLLDKTTYSESSVFPQMHIYIFWDFVHSIFPIMTYSIVK